MDENSYGLNVTSADMEAVKAVHGSFTSRVFIQIDGLHLRVNLGEMISGEPRYHTAAVMLATDALAYSELIREMAQRCLDQNTIAPADGE